jgi:ergothioneine biosynthesis protein EgtB
VCRRITRAARAASPAAPTYRESAPASVKTAVLQLLSFTDFEGGLVEIGHGGADFAFDSERPRHRVLTGSFRVADRLVTNAEWMEFIEDGGYTKPPLWLSEGWAKVLAKGWSLPLYWETAVGQYWMMTLRGFQLADPTAPLAHVSYFEADAFATWSGKRLPSDAEWEVAARRLDLDGNFLDLNRLRPKPASPRIGRMQQMFGDVWEWTRSPFSPYLRCRAVAVGEYNGKFMSEQFVLRGGSRVTPSGRLRASYRNFFRRTRVGNSQDFAWQRTPTSTRQNHRERQYGHGQDRSEYGSNRRGRCPRRDC